MGFRLSVEGQHFYFLRWRIRRERIWVNPLFKCGVTKQNYKNKREYEDSHCFSSIHSPRPPLSLLYFIGFKRLPIRLLKLMDGAMTSMFWHNWMWHVLSLPIVFIFYINFWKKNKKCHNTYLLLKITALLLLWHNDLIDTSLIIIKTKYYIMSPYSTQIPSFCISFIIIFIFYIFVLLLSIKFYTSPTYLYFH